MSKPSFRLLLLGGLALVCPPKADAQFKWTLPPPKFDPRMLCTVDSDIVPPSRGFWWGSPDSSSSPTMAFRFDDGTDRIPISAFESGDFVDSSFSLVTYLRGFMYGADGADSGTRQREWQHRLKLDNQKSVWVCSPSSVNGYSEMTSSVLPSTVFYQGRAFDDDTWKACRWYLMFGQFPNVSRGLECNYEISGVYRSDVNANAGSASPSQLSNGRVNNTGLRLLFDAPDPDSDNFNSALEFEYGTDPFHYDTDRDGVRDDGDWCNGTNLRDPASSSADVKRGLVSGVVSGQVHTVPVGGAATKSFTIWMPNQSGVALPSSILVGGRSVPVATSNVAASLNNRLKTLPNFLSDVRSRPAWTRPSVSGYSQVSGTVDLTSYITSIGNGSNQRWGGWGQCTTSSADMRCSLSLNFGWAGGGNAIVAGSGSPLATAENAIRNGKCVASYLAELPGATPALSATLSWPGVDADGDGLLNVAEQTLGTNPFIADSDGDGLSDGVEECVGAGSACRKTHANDADSDNDGLPDGCRPGQAGCTVDPCNRYSLQRSDGSWVMTEYPVELAAGTIETDPDCDLDDDYLQDPDEANLWSQAEGCRSCSNPDWDNDGIPDGVEATFKTSVKNQSIAVTMLYHPDQIDGGSAGALAQRVESFYSGVGVELKVLPTAVAGVTKENYIHDCQPVTPEADSGIWLLDELPYKSLGAGFAPRAISQSSIATGPSGYRLTKEAVAYSHVARLCLDGPTWQYPLGTIGSADFGQIRGQGSSEFTVRFPPRPGDVQAAQVWTDALVSLTAHQLGHSLNLHHGGRTSEDCNPFYPSVMNHAYDFQPVAESCGVDVRFSSGTLAPVKDNPDADYGHLSVPMSEMGWPNMTSAAPLDVLGCWTHGDGLDMSGLFTCTSGNRTNPACSACPEGTTCMNVYELESRDLSTSLSSFNVAALRVAGALEQPRVSGCDLSVLYPEDPDGDWGSRYELPAAHNVLRDHDDVAWIKASLRLTVPYGRYRWEQAPGCTKDQPDCPESTLGVLVTEPTGPGNFPRWVSRQAFGIAPSQ